MVGDRTAAPWRGVLAAEDEFERTAVALLPGPLRPIEDEDDEAPMCDVIEGRRGRVPYVGGGDEAMLEYPDPPPASYFLW